MPAKSGGGMAGSESNPAALFRLYIDYGRYTEATNLLLEYIESFASLVSFSSLFHKAFDGNGCCKGFYYSSSLEFWLLCQSSNLLRFNIRL